MAMLLIGSHGQHGQMSATVKERAGTTLPARLPTILSSSIAKAGIKIKNSTSTEGTSQPNYLVETVPMLVIMFPTTDWRASATN